MSDNPTGTGFIDGTPEFSHRVVRQKEWMNYALKQLFLVALTLVLLSGADLVQAQKSSRSASPTTTTSTQPNYKKIRARAGESIRALAERAGFDAEELAKLNQLSAKAKLKKGQVLLLPDGEAANEPANERSPNGMLIKFADGGTLHVDNAWWRGSELWYTRRGVTETTDRSVKSVEPVFVAAVESRNPVIAPRVSTSDKPEKAKAETWIYLVGGARFKVDDVNKTSDGAWYQRGNLLSFLESTRIERIEREVPGAHPSKWQGDGWSSGNSGIDQLIRSNSARFGVDPYLVFLVIEQESHFRTRALSPKGAQGLMQLMPGTARRFGVRRPYDPAENIRGGTQYLKELLTMFKGRVDLALASYNAGEGRVISYGNKVPPFQETQNYVRKINGRYKKGTAAKTGG